MFKFFDIKMSESDKDNEVTENKEQSSSMQDYLLLQQCISMEVDAKHPDFVKNSMKDLKLKNNRSYSLTNYLNEKTFPSVKEKRLHEQNIKKSEELHTKAVQYYADHKINDALLSLNAALSLNPKNVDALVSKGALLANSNREEEAVEYLEKAASLQPDHENAKKFLKKMMYARKKKLAKKKAKKEAKSHTDTSVKAPALPQVYGPEIPPTSVRRERKTETVKTVATYEVTTKDNSRKVDKKVVKTKKFNEGWKESNIPSTSTKVYGPEPPPFFRKNSSSAREVIMGSNRSRSADKKRSCHSSFCKRAKHRGFRDLRDLLRKRSNSSEKGFGGFFGKRRSPLSSGSEHERYRRRYDRRDRRSSFFSPGKFDRHGNKYNKDCRARSPASPPRFKFSRSPAYSPPEYKRSTSAGRKHGHCHHKRYRKSSSSSSAELPAKLPKRFKYDRRR